MRLVWGGVVAITGERPGLQRLSVRADGAETDAAAVVYTALCEPCAVGDRVLLNTTAVDMGLGTGGAHMVVARLAANAAPSGVAFDDSSGGHIMKLRYTPMQRDVLAVESPESPHHAQLAGADDVGGMPVVCCGLHSQIPLVAAAIKERFPSARVVYCMTDEAALPIALSELVPACRAAGLLDATVTCGQSFGGDLESVTLHSGLLAARHVAKADVAIVALGPGIAGTGSVFGHGGIAMGEAVNAAGSVGGRPVAVLRISFTEGRERHNGVSHHSLTALSRVALFPATVAVPLLPQERAARVAADLADAGVWALHVRRDVPSGPPLPDTRGVSLRRSIGSTPDNDPAFFAAAAAGGYAAAAML